jgi:molecular chaperone GrpE
MSEKKLNTQAQKTKEKETLEKSENAKPELSSEEKQKLDSDEKQELDSEEKLDSEQEKEEVKSEENEKSEKPESKKAEVVIEETKSETEILSDKLNALNDKYLRLSAEFDNYRKRTLKEKMELTKSGGESILLNILPVMDNFERARKSVEDAKDMKAIKEGLGIIYKNFIDFLKQNGIKEIDALGKKFDTDLHEAITKIPAPKKKLKGKVVDIIEKGYFLHNKVIRFSKVVIGE